MKPIKLVLQAFGPFKNRQEIDLSLLEEDGVFLITGDTGSGKTTLLDAMAFALYGKASGESRLSSSFKSHHADINDMCKVEFTFLLRGSLYHVVRTPQQFVGKKRGEGVRLLNETAELTLPDGSILSGSREVDPKICDLIGLNREQFKQTIVLAQGEFMALLAANSTKKQKMFSQIFNTDPYREIAEELTLELKGLEGKLAGEQSTINRAVGELVRIGHRELDAPDAEFRSLGDIRRIVQTGTGLEELRMAQITGDIEALEQQRLALNLEGAKTLNEQLDQLELLKKRKEELDALQQEMAVKDVRLQRLTKAKELSFQEKVLEKNKTHLSSGADRAEALTADLASHKPIFEAATEHYAMADSLSLQADKLRKECDELKAREDTARKNAETRESLALNQKRTEKAARSLAQMELLQQWQGRARQMDILDNALVSATKLREANAALESAKVTSLQADDDHAALLERYLAGQAASLAQTLAEGQPCPVCGSLHHPIPAAGELAIAEEQLKKSEKSASKAREKMQQAQVAAERLGEQLALRLDAAGLPDAAAAETSLRQLQIQDRQEREEHPDMPSPPQDIAAALVTLRDLLAALREEASGFSALVGQSQEEDPQQLEQQRNELEKEMTHLVARQKSYIEGYLAAKARQDTLLAENTEAMENLARNREHFRALEADFRQKLEHAGFAEYDDYSVLLPQLEEIVRLEEELNRYRNSTIETQAQIAALQDAVKGKARADLDALKLQWDQLTEQIEEKRQLQGDAAAYLRDSKRCLEEIEAVYRRTGKLNHRYHLVRELESVAKGRSAPHIDFERFVLVSYFHDIIGQANIYLQKMTDSRYRLVHKSDGTSRTAGLDLEVYDAYTGTHRDVSTLSGGEGFKAALALAMGLSSIVQIYAGGISLEAIFIDEGFGSLDEKSLGSAVQTLLSLGRQGRMVGIISHVQELWDYIPAKLVVSSSPTGSRASFSLL